MAIELSDETIDKLVDKLILRGNKFAAMESELKLRNTRVLLQNYQLLRNHLDVELPALEDDAPLSKKELNLYSLLGYRARSKEMMEFVNEVIDRYRVICEGGSPEQSRRFTVIQKLYLQLPTLTIKRIATYLNVDEKTVRRDEHAAVNELSIMLFGIDGLNDLSK